MRLLFQRGLLAALLLAAACGREPVRSFDLSNLDFDAPGDIECRRMAVDSQNRICHKYYGTANRIDLIWEGIVATHLNEVYDLPPGPQKLEQNCYCPFEARGRCIPSGPGVQPDAVFTIVEFGERGDFAARCLNLRTAGARDYAYRAVK